MLARTTRTRDKRSIHVLLVEDDFAISEMYQTQLEHDGYQVTVASTALIGLELIRSGAPDVVLLDVLLPDRSGFELMMMLHDAGVSLPPMVILSNYGEPGMVRQGRSLGAVEYLVKSRVTPAEVSRSIPGWIEHSRGPATN
ncbi:MAG TPA: response regulator [Candidatus Dormibacteraeota bacterium]|nr:response regulator [Candidatus Dormibacteraeota bacterium]